MLSARSKIQSASQTVAGWISSFLHFSVPDEGPLSDFDESMPDMIDLMVNGINDNKFKLMNTVKNLSDEMENKLSNAVNIETGKMNATATVRSNSLYNSVIQLNAKFDGVVEMDKQKTGRILTPYVTKTIKAGGIV